MATPAKSDSSGYRRQRRPESATRPQKAERSGEQLEVRKLVPQREFATRVLFVLVVAIITWIAYMALPALILLFAAVVLAVVFHGCAKQLQRVTPLGPKLALAVTILGFIGIFTAAIVFLAPRVSTQFRDAVRAIPDAYERFAESEVGSALLEAIQSGQQTGDPAEQIPIAFDMSVLGTAANWATATLSAVASLTLVFVVAIFISANPCNLRNGIISLFPIPLRPRVGEVVEASGRSLWRWTIGQAFAMLVIGVLATIVYMSIGLNFALTLGVIAGLFQFIPYLGPALSAVPAVIVGFSMSSQMALWVIIAYAGIQTIEGNFITPMIMKREAYLPPVLSIMSTVVFGLLFGLAGAALATPLVIVFLTLYRNVYQEDILGVEAANKN